MNSCKNNNNTTIELKAARGNIERHGLSLVNTKMGKSNKMLDGKLFDNRKNFI